METRSLVRPLFLVATLVTAMVPSSARAATVASNADSGAGSLRAAIAAAAPGETIDFAITGVIALTSGELAINKNLTIDGPGAQDLSIQGGSSRVFSIALGSTVTISGLTITQGVVTGGVGSAGSAGTLGMSGAFSSDGGPGGPGGPGVGGAGGGILNHGSLTVVEVAFVGNSVLGGVGGTGGTGGAGGQSNPQGANGGLGGLGGEGEGGRGAAIFNDGDLTVLRCEFSSNSARGGIGGIGGRGGNGGAGLFGPALVGGTGGRGGNGGTGESGRGAGLFNAGTATVIDSTFASNGSLGGLGGLGGRGGDGGAVDPSSGGEGSGGAGGNGGDAGLGSAAIDNVGSLTLTFVTAAANSTADGTAGTPGNGGVAGCCFAPLSRNGPSGSPGTVLPAFGATLAQNGTATVRFSILSSPDSGTNCSGTFTSGGYNVSFAADTSCDASLTGTGDLAGADPSLQVLLLNPPGETRTAAIDAGGAAHDIVPPGVCVAAATVDQRGVARPEGAACDAGAFELEAPTQVTEVPTLGGWALLALGVALAGVAIALLRR